jgi:hypothetical protein
VSEASEERKEVRAQRHDFIKEYYRMATLDLDRHLKAGWQTIAVLAGGAAILTAGHDGKIGLPIATSIALVSAIWGVLSVIDANYWSLRAIGFLSNVEAVYFSVEDRKVFNPYIGYHPLYKLLDSLRYMFWLCLLFGAAALLSMVWEVTRSYPTLSAIWNHMETMPASALIFWSLPILVALWGLVWTYSVWRSQLGEYIDFSRGSPGPGVRLKTADLRHVTLQPISGANAPAIDPDHHANTLATLDARLARLRRATWLPWTLAIAASAAVALRALFLL